MATYTIEAQDTPQLVRLEPLHPRGKMDYVWDWTGILNGDEIQSSVFVAPSGLTKSGENSTTTTAGLTLEPTPPGNHEGREFLVTNRVTTQGGRILNATVIIEVRVT